MYCEECHRTECDPIMLDTETCGVCGSFLKSSDDKYMEELVEEANQRTLKGQQHDK